MHSFVKEDIVVLAQLLLLPEFVVLDNRCKIPRVEALCIVLWRLAYPSRLHIGARMFGRSTSVLSRVFAWAIEHLHNTFAAQLTVRACCSVPRLAF